MNWTDFLIGFLVGSFVGGMIGAYVWFKYEPLLDELVKKIFGRH